MHSFQVSHKAVDERLADSIGVSTIRVDLVFERNTPKLSLTLYVPIFILLALFLGSILIPSKFFNRVDTDGVCPILYIFNVLYFQLHLVKNLAFK